VQDKKGDADKDEDHQNEAQAISRIDPNTADDAATGKRKAEVLASDADVTASLQRSIKRHRSAAEVLMATGAEDTALTEIPPYAEPVLLAGRFFDEKLAGYLEEKDLEDIVHLTQRLTCRRWVQGILDASVRRGRLRWDPLTPHHVVSQIISCCHPVGPPC
jgi:hypothetical protein